MALFLQQKDGRSELQERIAAEMKERMQQNLKNPTETPPAMLDGQNKTRPIGMAIIALVVVVGIVFAVWAGMQNMN